MGFKIKPFMGLFGLLGFMGLLYFKFYNPTYLIFFCFFGFFSFFWWGKYSDIKEDEMFLFNQNKAYSISLRVGLGMIFSGMVFLNILLKSLDADTKYALLLILISLDFSIVHVLYAYLLNKFETDED